MRSRDRRQPASAHGGAKRCGPLTGQRWKENGKNLTLVEERLSHAFAGKPNALGGGSIVWRRQPALLWRYLEESLEEEEREEHGGLEYWPGSVAELLEGRLHPLLSFYWGGWGPMSWVAGLEVLQLERSAYLCLWDERESYRALARLERWNDRPLLSQAVRELLRANGQRQGVAVFGSLPSETTNKRPDLIPTAVLKQAYFDWLQWQEAQQGTAWLALAEEHFGRIVEPNHLQRSLDLLTSLPALDDAGALSDWLERRSGESAALPDHIRQRLFDDWFATSYEASL